ncbi:MAG TPA: sugar ABC transporter permease, partial [Lachnospiraceae bacterium]|nr:sugar ABC transporter permease [Lachnospiraceae bacterium]
QTWMWYGYTMIILISGVLGISPDIFDAAEVDGANGWQTFWRVTLPNIRTILLFTLVTSLIGGLNMFDIPKLFLLGGPDNATLTTNVFIYNQAFSGGYLYNRAAAASMIMFVLIILSSAVLFYLLRDKDEEKLRRIEKAEAKKERRAKKEGAR